MHNRLLSVVLGITVAGVVLGAQSTPAPTPAPAPSDQPVESPPVTFRVQVDYVEVDATVTDGDGNPVRDLSREDFEVLEDGVPQKVELFSFVNVPVVPPDPPALTDGTPTPIEPDVQTNVVADGRLYVLMLDDLHTSFQSSTLVKRAAREFVERHVAANDLTAVVYMSGRTDASQEFTGNKRLLLRAVDQFMGRKLGSATLARRDAFNQRVSGDSDPITQGARPQDINDPDDLERASNARSAMGSLANIAQFMEGVRGRRKALLYFSEGIDYDINSPFDEGNASVVRQSVRDAIGSATRANAVIYGIDPRGLSANETPIDMQGSANSFVADPNFGITPMALKGEFELGQDSLRVLADQTGGYAALNSNDFSRAFDRIVRENSSYYVLGYYPTDGRRDGRFRRIEVRLKRPGLQVRARSGYVARREADPLRTTEMGETSPKLREALHSPVPETGLAMAISAAPFKGQGSNASVLVTVRVDGDRFRFTERDKLWTDTLEMSVVAIDASGRIHVGDRQALDMKLLPQTAQLVEAAGFRMDSRLSLEPGRYQIRAGVLTGGTDSVGTVLYDLEVPDFSKERFSMSGLVVTSDYSAMMPSARMDPQLKEVLATPETTSRTFSAADTLRVFAEVYDNQVEQAHQVDISTTLRQDRGRVVFGFKEERSTDELQGARGGYGHVAVIPLRDVAPGNYVLRVEAQSRLSGSTPVVREARIQVNAPPGAEAPAEVPRALVEVARGTQSQVGEPRTVVARNDAEWQALWSSLQLQRPMPRVSFGNTMIAAVFLGSRPSAGYGVEIVGVKRDGETLVVEYVERQPREGTVSAAVVTTPYAVVGVPMFAGEVRFDKLASIPE